VFLDRDGTIIVHKPYLSNVEGVELVVGAGEALAALSQAGLLLVLITNQSGVGRGYYPRSTVDAQHVRLAELLAAHGVKLAGVEVCPHHPDDGCTCRKPLGGMLRCAAERLGIDLRRSFMVGDKACDVEAGRSVLCRTVSVGGGVTEADFAAQDIRDAVSWILEQRETEVETA